MKLKYTPFHPYRAPILSELLTPPTFNPKNEAVPAPVCLVFTRISEAEVILSVEKSPETVSQIPSVECVVMLP